MRKILSGALCALCLAALLSGCSTFSFGNVNELLRAPALGEEQGDIQRTLTAYLGQDPEYKFPKEGDNHSPIVLADLNGDGVEEGILFYTVPDAAQGSNVHVAVLEQVDDEWAVKAERTGTGTEIASVDVADFFGDGTLQLVVGYGNTTLSAKTLELYSYTNGELSTITPEGTYTRYLLGSFTGSGRAELAVVSKGDPNLQLNFIVGIGGNFEYLQEHSLALHTDLESCVAISASTGADGQLYLILDCVYAPSGMLVSQILVYAEGQDSFYIREGDSAGQLNTMNDTARSSQLLVSRDIDGDGVVETPRQTGADSGIAEELALSYIEWVDFTAEEAQAKGFGLLDTANALYIQLPAEWRGEVTIEPAGDEGWQVKRIATSRVLLEYTVVQGADEAPQGGMPVGGMASAYLVPGAMLSNSELAEIGILFLT